MMKTLLMALVLAGGIWVATPPTNVECSTCGSRCYTGAACHGDCLCMRSGPGVGTCVSLEYRR